MTTVGWCSWLMGKMGCKFFELTSAGPGAARGRGLSCTAFGTLQIAEETTKPTTAQSPEPFKCRAATAEDGGLCGGRLETIQLLGFQNFSGFVLVPGKRENQTSCFFFVWQIPVGTLKARVAQKRAKWVFCHCTGAWKKTAKLVAVYHCWRQLALAGLGGLSLESCLCSFRLSMIFLASGKFLYWKLSPTCQQKFNHLSRPWPYSNTCNPFLGPCSNLYHPTKQVLPYIPVRKIRKKTVGNFCSLPWKIRHHTST